MNIIGYIQKHKIVVGAITLVVILSLALMFVFLKLKYSALLDLIVVPTDAEVLINGEKYKNGLYENLAVGEKHVVISRDGFDSQEYDIELKRDEVTKLYTYLEGNDDWYTQLNDEDTLNLLNIVYEYKGELHKKELLENSPLLKELPIVYEKYLNNYTRYVSFRIDGGEYDECEQDFCLKITDISGGSYDLALNAIRERGYNPDNYELVYEDASKSGHAW